MLNKMKSAVIGSFVGDSMALGTHWVYDQNAIKERYAVVDKLLKPEMVEYHKGKEAGDFTHYGDQAYELLIDISTENRFDLNSFSSRFRSLFKGEDNVYTDHATQKTLDLIGVCTNYKECISHSKELAGASRIAPLLLAHWDDLDALKEATDSFVEYTHDDVHVKETAKFFAEVTYKIIHESLSPVEAIRDIMDSGNYPHIKEMIKTGLESIDKDSSKAVDYLGMSCEVGGALSSTVHIIAKYENDFKKAIIENVMAGGDSAARGMLIGMVLGAYLGLEKIPQEWLDGMKQTDNILGLIYHTKHNHYYAA